MTLMIISYSLSLGSPSFLVTNFFMDVTNIFFYIFDPCMSSFPINFHLFFCNSAIITSTTCFDLWLLISMAMTSYLQAVTKLIEYVMLCSYTGIHCIQFCYNLIDFVVLTLSPAVTGSGAFSNSTFIIFNFIKRTDVHKHFTPFVFPFLL